METRVAKAVDADQVIRLTQQLVTRASVTGDEAAVATYIADVLKGMGLSVECRETMPGRPNVIGVLAGPPDGRTILLNGHMDVVPPGEGWTCDPFGGLLAEGRIYGRGATDMKGGLAAMIGAISAIQRAGTRLGGTVLLTAVVGEEQDQIGTRTLVEGGLQADFALVGEPTQLVPVIAHKGDLCYRIRVQGKTAHSSAPRLGINAIDKMTDILVALRSLAAELQHKKHAHLGSPMLSVCTVEGGTDTCVVPGSCAITVDRRLLPNETAEEADGEFQRLLDRLQAIDTQLTCSVKRFTTALPMETSPDSEIAKAAHRASTAVLGYEPQFACMHSTTDASWLVNAAKIPTVIIGPGNEAQAHQADEFVEVEQVTKGAQVMALVIVDLLGVRR